MSTVAPPQSTVCLVKRSGVPGYEYTELPLPQPGWDEVLIKVEKVALCGSDARLYEWDEVAKVIANLPFTPGHEVVGTVVSTGGGCRLYPGQRVAVENHFFCGDCYQCKHGRGDICQKMGQYGHGKGTPHGGCSRYSILKGCYCYPLRHGLSDIQAVLLEPMGVAHNAIEQAEVCGEDVCIIGCGAIGLIAISLAKTFGASRIFAVDVKRSRLHLASRMGATHLIDASNADVKETLMSLTSSDGVSRVIEVSGNSEMLNSSFTFLRKGGILVVVGIPNGPLHVDNVLQDFLFKSLTIRTIHGRRLFHTWERCEELVAAGQVDPTPVVLQEIPMSRYEEAFRLLTEKEGCKIVMDPSR